MSRNSPYTVAVLKAQFRHEAGKSTSSVLFIKDMARAALRMVFRSREKTTWYKFSYTSDQPLADGAVESCVQHFDSLYEGRDQ